MKTNVRSWLRYPTLWLQLIGAVLTTVVSLNVGLSAAQAGALLFFVQVVIGAVNALAVRPIAPAAFVAVLGSAAGLLSAFHLWTPSTETLTAVSSIVTTGLALVSTLLTTPTYDPAVTDAVVTSSQKVIDKSL